jgi:hypothetical protein
MATVANIQLATQLRFNGIRSRAVQLVLRDQLSTGRQKGTSDECK